jgi:hypothetical protein
MSLYPGWEWPETSSIVQVWKKVGLHNPGGGALKIKRTASEWGTADEHCAPSQRWGTLNVKVAAFDGPGAWRHASWMRRG